MARPRGTDSRSVARPSSLTAQSVADALSLLACAACTDADSLRHSALAVIGGLTLPLLVLSLPALLLGNGGVLSLASVCAFIAAVGVRVHALSGTRAVDQPEPSLQAMASAFLFVPEVLYRTLGAHNDSGCVEVWRTKASARQATLSISGIPSSALLRRLARDAHAQPVTLVNLCEWWAGWRDACADLNLATVRHPAGRAGGDVLAIVTTLKKLCQTGGGAGGEESSGSAVGMRVILFDETGAFAAAVAAAFLTSTDAALDPASAATLVADAVRGRVPCSPTECERLAALVCQLTGRNQGGRKSKPAAAPGSTAAAVHTASRSAGNAVAGERAGANASASDEDDDDDDNDNDDDDNTAAEQAERWATYQRAVASYGLPNAGAKPATVAGGGWTEVAQPVRRPAASYAVAARLAEAKAQAAAAEEQRMTDKQRKNRRKAEKAKEASAAREAERKERLAEAIRQRARG